LALVEPHDNTRRDFVADDHALFRKGFGLCCGMLFQGWHQGGRRLRAALDLLASSPQMTGAFFDLMMPGMAGPDSIRPCAKPIGPASPP
jgi:hypothetical protein